MCVFGVGGGREGGASMDRTRSKYEFPGGTRSSIRTPLLDLKPTPLFSLPREGGAIFFCAAARCALLNPHMRHYAPRIPSLSPLSQSICNPNPRRRLVLTISAKRIRHSRDSAHIPWAACCCHTATTHLPFSVLPLLPAVLGPSGQVPSRGGGISSY